jgi:chromosome segregation ATPase
MGDEAVETLKLIWGEMKTLNSKIDRTREELSIRLDRTREELSERLDRTREELSGRLTSLEGEVGMMRDRMVESEMRLATEVVTLAGIMKDVRDNLQAAGQTRFALIEERLTRLEKKVS